jgi:hypothetical protein
VGRAALIVVSVSIGIATAASASATPSAKWKTYNIPSVGVRLSIPATWRTIPRSVPAVRALIARLRRQGQYSLAARYASYIDPSIRKQITDLAFDAFRWPAEPSLISTDVNLKTGASDGKSAEFITLELAGLLRKHGHGTIDPPRFVQLRAGRAGIIHGIAELDPTYHGARSDSTIYIFVRGARLYALNFRAGSKIAASERSVFSRIAASFDYL